jgi:hypothetical protein
MSLPAGGVTWHNKARHQQTEGQVTKLLGILCIVVAVASIGWKAYSLGYTGDDAGLRHIGDVSVSDGTTVQFTDKGYHVVGAGGIDVVLPIVLQVDRALWLASAALAFAAGIVLLNKAA